VLTLPRVVGALAVLKAADVALRGPLTTTSALAAAVLAAGGAALVAGRGRAAWAVVLAGAVLSVVDLPFDLVRQHVVLLGLVALVLIVARDDGERLLLLRVQVSALYGVAALAKLNEPYLAGTVIGAAVADAPSGTGAVGVLPLPVLVVGSLGLIAAEVLLAVTPWLPRLHTAGLLTAVGFHISAVPLAGHEPLVALRLLVFGGLSLALVAAVTGRLPLAAGRARAADDVLTRRAPAALRRTSVSRRAARPAPLARGTARRG
jgi:hypothetical protein